MKANRKQMSEIKTKLKIRDLKVSLILNGMSSGYGRQAVDYLIKDRLTVGELLKGIWPTYIPGPPYTM